MRTFLAAAGRTPVEVKSRLFMRAARFVTRRVSMDQLIVTNLGISNRLRVQVPARYLELAFGRPHHQLAERASYDLCCALVPFSNVFVDVGANEGLFTFGVAAAGMPNIHAFEPDVAIHARLADNVQRNGISARVNRVAVGAVEGEQVFYRNLDSPTSGSLTEYFRHKHRTVPITTPVTTLQRYLVDNGISEALVKIDVEGAGVQVWRGAQAALDRIKWMLLEIIEPEAEAGLPRIIEDAGLLAYYVRDYEIVRQPQGRYRIQDPFYNWLFCRLTPVELSRVLPRGKFTVVA